MTALNIWHYGILLLILILFVLGIVRALQEKSPKMRYSMLFTVSLISLFLAIFSIFVVDKYTKKVKLYDLQNRRILSIEKIVYSGSVKNVGDYPIAKVTLEIKLVNHGHATGNVKGGNFYKPSGFLDFFSNGLGIDKSKPQTVIKKFVVARNLKPGTRKRFRVYFDYPPYFSSTAQFAKVSAH